MRMLFVFTLCLTVACHAQEATPTPGRVNLKNLYDRQDWYGLRTASQHEHLPLFYKAAIEVAFDRFAAAEKDLKKVESVNTGDQLYEALGMSVNLYFRHGRYHEALNQLRRMSGQKPDAEDVKQTLPLLQALSEAPNQSTIRCEVSTVDAHMVQGNLFVPTRIGDVAADFIVDSGANFSLMSYSEAERLGLKIFDSKASMGDSSGTRIGMKIANAPDLEIGGLHIKNVRFGLIPDSQEPFIDLPVGHRGILGISVVLAMRTIRWTSTGAFTSCIQSSAPTEPNIFFNGMSPVARASYDGHSLFLPIDTGAIRTDLDPPFAAKFPDLVSTTGRKEQHRITGVGGSTNYEAVELPSLAMEIGGTRCTWLPHTCF